MSKSEKLLIMNDDAIGTVAHYEQDRKQQAWIFTMADSMTVTIPFSEIKLFTSAENLEVITNNTGRF